MVHDLKNLGNFEEETLWAKFYFGLQEEESRDMVSTDVLDLERSWRDHQVMILVSI